MLTNNSQIQEAAHMPTQQPDFDPSVLNNVHALHETSVKPSAETERERALRSSQHEQNKDRLA